MCLALGHQAPPLCWTGSWEPGAEGGDTSCLPLEECPSLEPSATSAGCKQQLGHAGDGVSPALGSANLVCWLQGTDDKILARAFWRGAEAKVQITYLWGRCITNVSLSYKICVLCGSFPLCLWAKGAWRSWVTCHDADLGEIGLTKVHKKWVRL